jgi:hypothetical protein
MFEMSPKSEAPSMLEGDWVELDGTQVSEYLLDLRTTAMGIGAIRKNDGCRFSLRMARLTESRIEMVIDHVPAGEPVRITPVETIWCFVYAQEYALSFVLMVEDALGESFHTGYPVRMWIRKDRRHKRFIPRVPMQATWHREGTPDITGDVMDIGLGGFLGGVNVVTKAERDPVLKEDDYGLVRLSRDEGTIWSGEGVLRRISWVGDRDHGELSAFLLLGFAFVFRDEKGMRQLTEFLDGLLESM